MSEILDKITNVFISVLVIALAVGSITMLSLHLGDSIGHLVLGIFFIILIVFLTINFFRELIKYVKQRNEQDR